MDSPPDPKQRVVGFLGIIDYEGDREKYAEEILGNCVVKTMGSLLANTPEPRKETLTKVLASEKNLNVVIDTLKNEFTDQEFTRELEKTTEKVFAELTKSLAPALSTEQKEKLKTYLSSSQ